MNDPLEQQTEDPTRYRFPNLWSSNREVHIRNLERELGELTAMAKQVEGLRRDREHFKNCTLELGDQFAKLKVQRSQLVKTALLNQVWKRSQFVWAAARDIFGLGSTSAIELCKECGINPHTSISGLRKAGQK